LAPLQNAWDSHASDGRARYGAEEAAVVTTGVHDFMALVSTRLQEAD